MAFSSSLEKAQTFSLCQFCKESSDLKWKCIICDLYLCQFCNSQIHSKNDTLRCHKVINLTECGTKETAEIIRKLDLTRLQCSTHEGENCCVYCVDCDTSICSECLSESSHQSHKYEKLDKIYKMKVNEIQDTKFNLESNLSYFENEEEKLKQTLLTGENKFTEIKDKILQKEKDLKETVTKYAQELILELESDWQPLEAEITREISEVTHKKRDLEIRTINLDQTLQSHEASDIFLTSHSLDKTLPLKAVKQVQLKDKKILLTDTSKFLRKSTFGTLYTVPKLELLRTYQTHLKSVENLLLCKDQTALISNYNKLFETMQKVKLDSDTIKIQEDLKIIVYDMAMMSNGNVLISAFENNLYLYNNDTVEKFLKFPLITLGVHVSEDEEILIGLSDSPFIGILNKDSTRKCVVLDKKGESQHSYEFDNNERLFTFPDRICTFEDNIYIVDVENEKLEGRVVVVNKGGQLQWVYNGCDTMNTDGNKFSPRDITISKSAFILISDYSIHAIHILNQQGEIITCKCVSDLGIENPYCLSIDINGLLWIGCEINDRNVHCLKMIQ